MISICALSSADCQPPCQNRGSCSRPQTCVCRSGFQGPRCEELIKGLEPSPIPNSILSLICWPVAHRSFSCSVPLASHQHTPSHTYKPPFAQTGSVSQSRLTEERMQLVSSLSLLLLPLIQVCVCFPGANLTSNLDRIKIVFTPMRCRRVCNGGHCYNSCEKGDITTVYSETSQHQQQQQQPKNQGFRLFFCQIPCLNGGRCIGRDQCWCPTNSTGKFCHLPAPPPVRPTPRSHKDHQGPKSPFHSMYTLPLSNQQVSLHPSLVNVHIQHPPEAEVHVHQVARVQPGQRPTEGAHSVRQRSQPANGHEFIIEHSSRHPHTNGNGHGHTRLHHRQNGHGRCFQETVDGQCGKPLPGLTKQDDCCGSVGASWGINKCQKCQSDFFRYSTTDVSHFFTDINECLFPGICKNAECLNTKGSYRCTCKQGYMLDPESKHCVSDKAVSDQRALCYRSVSAGTCSLPLAQHITKQICCCSRVGKAWGAGCDRCPLPESDHFKEICPAGHGYTYSRSDVQISLRHLGEDDVQSTGLSWEEQSPVRPHPPSSHPSQLLPFVPQHPSHPQTPHIPQYPEYPETPQAPQRPLTPQQPLHPSHPARETPKQQEVMTVHISVALGFDKCAAAPTICGRGKCVPVQTGYTCHCDLGFKLSALQTNCIDVNECDEDPCEGKGRCINSYGSYTCQCHSGYSQVITQNRKFCQDINECSMPNKCQNGNCVNTEGSYTCECNDGFAKSWRGQCEDVDECMDPSSCPSGVCVNTIGSFQCQGCGPGLRPAGDRCVDVDECVLPGVCLHGRCVNLDGTHKCTCNHGYQATSDSKDCEDMDECSAANVCPGQLCLNSPGSYTCRSCGAGLRLTEDGYGCEDIDECQTPGACPTGVCTNTEGSFSCVACDPGFRVAPNGLSCEDVNECEDNGLCLGGQCTNSVGSYSCSCPDGLELVDGTSCRDVNECLTIMGICGEGDCLNTEGSYTCLCPDGYATIEGRPGCQDVDECSKDNVCIRGNCLNTDGSFFCLCESVTNICLSLSLCTDQNECKELGSSLCGTWRCENTIGSYRCFMGCQPGLEGEDATDCDIDECVNETICGNHSFCENTDGSFRCQCDQGYTNPPGDASKCVDVNECEMTLALCGEALCENFDGSFLCICPNDNEEFDPITSQCRSLGNRAGLAIPPPSTSAEEKKECYINLNDANFCDNVVSRNTTKQECCCTVGKGWGDNCEIYAYDFNQLCPHGGGLLPVSSRQALGDSHNFIDANECEMFGSDICKNGQCSNLFSTYTCYCRSGFYYDNIRLECVDYDECGLGNACEDGECVNTAGSFNCFCSPPLVLDSTRRRCISLNTTEGPDHDVHMDICWQRLERDNMCAEPLQGHRTTYTECCCLYGVAWSGQCAFCPRRDSEDYAIMCNLARRGDADSLRERPGYEYGIEGPEDPAEPFVPPYFDSYGNPAGPYDVPESVPLFTDNDYSVQQPPARVPVQRPRESQPQPVDPYAGRYDAFEGLRAEECGILNGCENGRCVRVREGYTCDCFDGYEFDLSKMACIDINECEDISDKVPLCQNGQCTNTEGSYKCTCLPGFVASAKPHKCIPAIPESELEKTEN
uniref:Latent transforming growth factor beta binding protein 2 n=1 Tax=Sparus aurata TaxID=8175 RepID=A0A671YS24_SPAAU